MSYRLDPLDDAHRECDRLDRLQDEQDAAHESLMSDALDAFHDNADAMLRTPHEFVKTLPAKTAAWEVFADHLTSDRESVHAILGALRHCLKSADPAVRLPAQAVFAKIAKGYADSYVEAVVAA